MYTMKTAKHGRNRKMSEDKFLSFYSKVSKRSNNSCIQSQCMIQSKNFNVPFSQQSISQFFHNLVIKLFLVQPLTCHGIIANIAVNGESKFNSSLASHKMYVLPT